MKPAPFKYLAARSFEEAVGLKAEHGAEARFLAGGQSLVPMLNFRLLQPAALIDINAITAGAEIRRGDGELRIGALARYRALQASADVAAHCPLIAEALPLIAHAQIRNRGTLGGNLCQADPPAELPAIMLALGARMRLRSARGERSLDASAFFTGILSTALAPDEMLVEVALPSLGKRCGTAFLEVSRRLGDFALMGVAAVVSLDEKGLCRDARLAYCGAGEGPVLAGPAAAGLCGGRLDPEEIAAAAEAAAGEIRPLGSIHAGPAYQRHLARVLTRRALALARARASESGDGPP